VIDGEAHLGQPGAAHRLPEAAHVLGVEQQEASGAGADELAADGAVVHAELVPAVDVGVGHVRRALALGQPVLVHQCAVRLGLALLESLADPPSDRLGFGQPAEHRVVALDRALLLIGQHLAGAARVAREEQEQVLLEVAQRVVGNPEGGGVDRAVGGDFEAGQATECRDVLVLLADGLAQHVDLDVARLLGQLGGRHVLAPVRVQGPEQADGERPRGAEPGAGRDVGDADDLLGVTDRVEAQGLAHERVGDAVHVVGAFERRVLDHVPVGERVVDGHVHVAVDGGRDEEAAAPLVVRRQVGAATTDRDAQGRAGDDHAGAPPAGDVSGTGCEGTRRSSPG
jgi:hypothetical protein